MKLLLDENLPHRLRFLIVGHDVFTVAFMRWKGVENGSLLALAADEGFDAVVTKDNGMPYEQNTATLPCGIVVLEAASNELADIEPLVPELLRQLATMPPRSILRIAGPP
jgi:predicted nuclease of predicted toxin-antitoxin system